MEVLGVVPNVPGRSLGAPRRFDIFGPGPRVSFQGDDIGQKGKFKAMARTLTGQSQVQQYTNQNVLLRSGPKVVC